MSIPHDNLLEMIRPAATSPHLIRNFSTITHIDHGKSTLIDRMLQLTRVVSAREVRAQYLDRTDIGRERGIMIKSQAMQMPWEIDGVVYVLNMIDTPGHMDFSYEVSRSLAACEGALLLVDASQEIEAQTLASLYLALESDLTIIPVLNKTDLSETIPEKHTKEVAGLLGCEPADYVMVSGRAREGVVRLLDHIVHEVPIPGGDPIAPTRAMIFDLMYDACHGIATYMRVADGPLKA